MRALILLVGVGLLVVLCYYGVRAYNAFVYKRKSFRGMWVAENRSIGPTQPAGVVHSAPYPAIEVRIVHPTEKPITVGYLSSSTATFDDDLHEKMSQARHKAAALNSERKSLTHRR